MPATKGVPETSAADLVRGDWSDGLPVLPGNLSARVAPGNRTPRRSQIPDVNRWDRTRARPALGGGFRSCSFDCRTGSQSHQV